MPADLHERRVDAQLIEQGRRERLPVRAGDVLRWSEAVRESAESFAARWHLPIAELGPQHPLARIASVADAMRRQAQRAMENARGLAQELLANVQPRHVAELAAQHVAGAVDLPTALSLLVAEALDGERAGEDVEHELRIELAVMLGRQVQLARRASG